MIRYLLILLVLGGCTSTGNEYCFPGREIDSTKEGIVCRNVK